MKERTTEIFFSGASVLTTVLEFCDGKMWIHSWRIRIKYTRSEHFSSLKDYYSMK